MALLCDLKFDIICCSRNSSVIYARAQNAARLSQFLKLRSANDGGNLGWLHDIHSNRFSDAARVLSRDEANATRGEDFAGDADGIDVA